MSWIKNQFNKLFKLDENEDYEDYVEDTEQPAQQTNQRQQDFYEEAQQPQPKKTFRFPLIDDEYETQSQKQTVESQSTSYYDEDRAQLSLPNHLQRKPTNEVLDVEVSGIRDLLERRRKGKGHSDVIRTPEPIRKVPVTKEERRMLTKNPQREDSNINKEFVNPLANRKRFVPTEVPSPVHGFLKPTPIEQLIEKQQDLQQGLKQQQPLDVQVQQEIAASEATENTPIQPLHQMEPTEQDMHKTVSPDEDLIAPIEPMIEPIEPTLVPIEPVEPVKPMIETDFVEEAADPILFEEEPATTESEIECIESQPEVAEPPVISLDEDQQVSQEPSVGEVLNDVQVKHVTIENSTIHIGQLNVEQLPQQEQDKIIEQAQQVDSQPVQQEPTGSRLPFNVLMLKSDKQKLRAKQFVAQQREQFGLVPEVTEIKEPIQAANVEEDTPTTNETIAGAPIDAKMEEILVDETIESTKPMDSNPIFEKNMEEAPQIIEAQPPVIEEAIQAANEEAQEQLIELEKQPEIEAEAPVTIQTFNQSAEASTEIAQQPKASAIGLLERENNIVDFEGNEQQEIAENEIQLHTTVDMPEVEAEQEPASVVDEEPPAEHSQLDFMENELVPVLEIASELAVERTHKAQPILEETVEEPAVEEPIKKRIPYVKPPLDYLVPPEEMSEDREWMDEQGENLVEALSYFQIQANIESIVQGPAVTQFEITVGQGTKVSKVRNLADDIKLALAAKDIRIDAPIPGKRTIGIEIPNRISRSVRLSEVTDSDSFRNSDSPLEAALGLDLTGKPVTIDLRKMPHGLIAGATGSGKSVCINSILVSLLYKANPNELKLMLIDPKMVELAPFNHIPHLVSPVITDVKAATAALKWAVEEMERRYQLFMHSGARKIEAYNKMCDENGMYAQKLPYLLIVIDELADLMMMSPQDVEDSIVRITQKARAAGIHLIVATQRPSVDVITGLIKSNIPTRIAFSVSSQIDSRTILDAQGAERLLGRGDMLYLGNGMSAPNRIQGTFVTDDEIEEIIEFVREQGEPEYIFKQEELLKRSEAIEEQDELFEEVCRFVYEQGSASTSLLQRRYHIGYNRAARLIDMLERQGYVSEPKGSKPRDVFITEEEIASQFGD